MCVYVEVGIELLKENANISIAQDLCSVQGALTSGEKK